MDEMTVRVMDILARELGHPLSIRELTKKIQESYGTAYYANTYRKLRNLLAHDAITIERAGKSSIVALNFSNYFITDMLAEMELVRKRNLLGKRPRLLMLLADTERHYEDSGFTRSMSLVDPERNMRLNRIELLAILPNLRASQDFRDCTLEMHDKIRTLESKHNIRIDALMQPKNEFLALLGSSDVNPIKEMLSNKVTFFHPQTFWTDMRDAFERGIHVRTRESALKPARLAEHDLIYNLARFGYKEIGTRIGEGEDICAEYIVASLLLKDEARRINAVPIILAKNKVYYSLLVFLSQKYGVADRLLGVLKALNRIKPTKKVKLATETLEALGVAEKKANERTMREKMALYDVA